MNIKLATTDSDIQKCWPAVKVLRPHLEEQQFLPMVKEMIAEGYKLAFVEEDNIAAAIIGFRYLQYLFCGKHIYIDDLSTLPDHRKKGLGSTLLDYVFEHAKQLGYDIVTLDSGYQRTDAHRLYLNKGFTISSHHFVKKLNGNGDGKF